MNQKSPTPETTGKNEPTMETQLSDDAIHAIALSMDKFIVDTCQAQNAGAIEFSAIAFGRLLMLCKQTGTLGTFMEMISSVQNLSDAELGIVNKEAQENGQS